MSLEQLIDPFIWLKHVELQQFRIHFEEITCTCNHGNMCNVTMVTDTSKPAKWTIVNLK